MKIKGNTTWRPAPYRRPMLSNGPVLGIAPALVARAIWPWVVRIGAPLLVGAGVIYASSSLLKSAVPSIPVNTRNIPQAALLGGLGVASYYTASLLPEKYAPIAYIGAVIGVASSIYLLFKDVATTQSGEGPTPAASSEAYSQVKALIDSPKRNAHVAIGFSDTYPLNITWLNDSPSTAIAFNYRFKTVERPSGIFGDGDPVTNTFLPASASPDEKPMGKISMHPKDSLPVQYQVPIKGTTTGWVAVNVDLVVEIFNPYARAWMPVSSQSYVVTRV
jgi:hypothetical protein